MPEHPQPVHTAIIRPAKPHDLAGIVGIEEISFDNAGERFDAGKVKFLLQSRRTESLVAEDDGKILGWAVGFTWPRGKIHWGRVFALAIHPEARGRKLGGRLLHELIQQLRRRGATEIFLEVRQDNHPAIALYRRCGFAHRATLQNFYAPGVHAWRMSLPAAV